MKGNRVKSATSASTGATVSHGCAGTPLAHRRTRLGRSPISACILPFGPRAGRTGPRNLSWLSRAGLALELRPLGVHVLECLRRRATAAHGIVDLLPSVDVPGAPPAGEPFLDVGRLRLLALQIHVAPGVDG